MIRPSFGDALRELLFCTHRSVEDVTNAFFDRGYVHRDNGKTYTRDEFAGLATIARSDVAHGSVSTLEEFRFWNRYAARLVLEVTKTDGSDEHTELYAIGQYSIDGRFLRINQARLSVPSAESVVGANFGALPVA
ncbi:hypothetical protein OK015_11225 [Mycobacterium sp. Aquia_216]|uniref:hypothetical protein n=1 Tax=Mycobacterium sp. Aquia_216 TaxID=2991729 RepID=UPI00227BFB42|nr:hypothetical protein [Mycobacterium sp. Aquia_216]WAJ46965.1 hypothetical protein OK015_11225 [Mycobacterium sp. Aquia_216]